MDVPQDVTESLTPRPKPRYQCTYHRQVMESKSKQEVRQTTLWRRVKSNILTAVRPTKPHRPRATSLDPIEEKIRKLNREIRVLRHITREKMTEQQLLMASLGKKVGKSEHSFLARTYNKLSRRRRAPRRFNLPVLPSVQELQASAGDCDTRLKASQVAGEVKHLVNIYNRNEAVESKKSFAWWFLNQNNRKINKKENV